MAIWTVFEPIKRRADCKAFREHVNAEDGGIRIRDDRGNVIEFTGHGDNWSVSRYVSNLGFGWVTCEIASDTNPGYKDSVDDLIWKYRKAINAYLNRE